MIPDRIKPLGIRMIYSGFTDQVPQIIESYVTVLRENAAQNVDAEELDYALRNIDQKLHVEHRPDRHSFESAFMAKRAYPAEIKIDPSTDRIYLVGLALPGREELYVVDEDVKDEHGNVVAREQITTSDIKDDAVLIYTEVSWKDYYTAARRLEAMEPIIQQALCRYFQFPQHLLLGMLLATPGLSDEDLHGIALYALQQPA